MKIAVVGSGIAGLSAAYWLSQESDVQVTLLERDQNLGMDSNRREIATVEHETVSADVPSRMFNAKQWPHLVALYDQIGVASLPVNASQSFTRIPVGKTDRGDTFLRLEIALRPELALRNVLTATPRKLLSEAKRLRDLGRADLEHGISPSLSFGDYLISHGFSNAFINEFLFPTLSSTVCTCSYRSLRRYPADVMVAALRRLTDDQALLRTEFGTRDVVNRLANERIEVCLGHTVQAIRETGDDVEIRIGDSLRRFDQVVVAAQANTARSWLPDSSDRQQEMLSAFRYETVEVLVHTDGRLMPRRQKDWCTFNMGVLNSTEGEPAAMCTVWLNRFHSDWVTAQNFFQTISPVVDPDPTSVLAKIRLQRPVVDQASVQALHALDELHQEPDRRVWFCGSWAARGIPLLETGVVSARTAVDHVLAKAAVH